MSGARGVFNCNGGAQIPQTTGNGNYCPLVVSYPAALGTNVPQTVITGQVSCDMLMTVSYLINTGGSATGTITFQELKGNSTPDTPVWVALVSPAAITLGAATTYNGTFTGAFHGVRAVVASLAVAPITYIELKGLLA